jgi:RHS repeat-associated protein
MRAISILLLALLCAVAASLAAEETTYVVTLRPSATTETALTAEQLGRMHGATIVSVTADGTIEMRLPPSRARVLVTDPRVQSVVPQTAATRLRPATESINWSSGVAYSYDGSGNVRQIGSDAFVYDAVNRLVQADTDGIRRNYEYDAFGNRSGCRQAQGTPNESDCQFGYTISPLTNRVNGATYDASGNLQTLGGIGTHTYTYDALNMQTSDSSGGSIREYVYTASDERIAVYTVGQQWNWTIRDTSGKVLREFTSADGPNGLGTASWQWKKDYVWRDGLLLASRQMSGSTLTTYHYHLDHLGTPRRITNDSDHIVGVHDYLPFGPETSTAQNEPSLTLLKYTGHERDLVTTGSWETLDYMRARYYSPALGRFLSTDPGRAWDPRRPQSWNLFAYTDSSPLTYVDPDGEQKIVYWVLNKAGNYWRQVERKVAVRFNARRSSGDHPHIVTVTGPGSSGKSAGVAADSFPGEKIVRHDAHPGGPSTGMNQHRSHHLPKKKPKQGGGQVNYNETIKSVIALLPYIGWAVEAEAASASDANPAIEARAVEMYEESFYELSPDEAKAVIESLSRPVPLRCPGGKVIGTSGPCD